MKDKIFTIVPAWGLKPGVGKPEPVYGWATDELQSCAADDAASERLGLTRN